MGEILTPWEMALMDMDIDDWLELNPCECEALCTCGESTD
jgi:hypothetical protein